jgi:protein-tyrosine phosphatase
VNLYHIYFGFSNKNPPNFTKYQTCFCRSIWKNYNFNVEDNGDKNNINLFFTKIIPEIHEIINDLLNNNQTLLVHCKAGSAIIIITWLMKYRNMDYNKAFIYVKERRPVISPNIYFIDYIKST